MTASDDGPISDREPVSSLTLELSRDNILNGHVQQIAARIPGMVVLSEAEMTASLDATLARRPADAEGPIWVFGYGSLMWNPAFHFVEQTVARVAGWHRSLCLWTQLGRGSPERPGLTLALDRGGSCCGVAYRVLEPASHELMILWRREMVGGAYRPRWVRTRLSDGRVVQAVTFTINRTHPRYAGAIEAETVAATVADAVGCIGACLDYVERTVASLKALGLGDAALEATLERARRLKGHQEVSALIPPLS